MLVENGSAGVGNNCIDNCEESVGCEISSERRNGDAVMMARCHCF